MFRLIFPPEASTHVATGNLTRVHKLHVYSISGIIVPDLTSFGRSIHFSTATCSDVTNVPRNVRHSL